MLSVTQAFDKLLATVEPLEAVSLPLSDVLGLTLAEDVSASEDSPPFDKSLMDGFAVRAADVANGFVSLKVVTPRRYHTMDRSPLFQPAMRELRS